jgi:hypothetical protein
VGCERSRRSSRSQSLCLKEVTAVAVLMRQSPQTNFVKFKIAVDGHRSH